MLVDTDSLPDPEQDPEGAADLYLALGEVRSWNVRASKALKKLVATDGFIESFHGTLGLVWDGWEYPPEVAMEFPFMGKLQITMTLPPNVEHERILGILVESMPELKDALYNGWKPEIIVDKEVAGVWAKQPDTPEGVRVRELRTAKKKLGKREGV